VRFFRPLEPKNTQYDNPQNIEQTRWIKSDHGAVRVMRGNAFASQHAEFDVKLEDENDRDE
jgi:hypothetical protein